MKHITYTLVFTAFVSALAYYALGHPSRGRVERLQSERAELEARNDALRKENEDLERTVVALRDDPRLAERRARDVAGLSRPDELIFTFQRAQAPGEVAVKLDVSPERIVLAGRELAIGDLSGSLASLRRDLPGAQLNVHYAKGVDALARQRVRDIVDASPLAPATYDDTTTR